MRLANQDICGSSCARGESQIQCALAASREPVERGFVRVDRASSLPPWTVPFAPSDKRSIGVITAEGSCVSTLPQRIAWATVDSAGTIASGSIWVAPYGSERDHSKYAKQPEITREELQARGLPLHDAARALNEGLGTARVEMIYRRSQCPIMELYMVACAKPSWTPKYRAWGQGSILSELTLRVDDRVYFEPYSPGLERGVEIEEKARRFVQDYHVARDAYLKLSALLASSPPPERALQR